MCMCYDLKMIGFMMEVERRGSRFIKKGDSQFVSVLRHKLGIPYQKFVRLCSFRVLNNNIFNSLFQNHLADPQKSTNYKSCPEILSFKLCASFPLN